MIEDIEDDTVGPEIILILTFRIFIENTIVSTRLRMGAPYCRTARTKRGQSDTTHT